VFGELEGAEYGICGQGHSEQKEDRRHSTLCWSPPISGAADHMTLEGYESSSLLEARSSSPSCIEMSAPNPSLITVGFHFVVFIS
jgi:hypothetical protein